VQIIKEDEQIKELHGKGYKVVKIIEGFYQVHYGYGSGAGTTIQEACVDAYRDHNKYPEARAR
jgi:hypothetical protein